MDKTLVLRSSLAGVFCLKSKLKEIMEYTFMTNGMRFKANSRFVDWEGGPVKKDKYEYRYSYDAYVVYKVKQDYQHCVYSDRLYQQDWDRHEKLVKIHFGNNGQYWSDRPREGVEKFLQDFYKKPELKLVGIMEGCSVSNGYPYWIFMFDCDFS